MLDGGPERQETTTGGVTAEDAQAPQHCEGMDFKELQVYKLLAMVSQC